MNVTKEQRARVAGEDIFDIKDLVYFVDRNILVEIGFNSLYIKDPQMYVEDSFSKLFNSNDNLFVEASQVRTVEDARKFEEWRSETFDR